MKITYNRPHLTNYQRKIVDCPERFSVTEAATKVGKTASHIVWLFEQCIALKKNQSGWWVAPTYSQAEIAYRRMKNQISDKTLFKFNETKLTIVFPSGSICWFKSAEKPDNLYGEDVYCCVFDEFTRAREEAWYALRSTLTATRGKCKFIGNVRGKKNWGYKMGVKAKAGEKDYAYFKITAMDAVNEGILSMQEIEQAQKDLPESVFRELYMAEASDDGSNPFGVNYIRSIIKPIATTEARIFGIDLAKKRDWTVITGLDSDGNICFFERFQKDWKQTTEEIQRIITDKYAYVDSTGVGDPIVETLQRSCNVTGFNYTSKSKQQLMEGLAYAIQNSKISVLPGILQDELESFEFEYTRTGVRYTAPDGMTDDCVNSLALAYQCLTENPFYAQYAVGAF